MLIPDIITLHHHGNKYIFVSLNLRGRTRTIKIKRIKTDVKYTTSLFAHRLGSCQKDGVILIFSF